MPAARVLRGEQLPVVGEVWRQVGVRREAPEESRDGERRAKEAAIESFEERQNVFF